MTLYEFNCKDGLLEILNFVWSEGEGGEGEQNDAAFERLGYRNQDLKLYSPDYVYWISVYKNIGNNEYEFLVTISNHLYSQYVACRSFPEFLEFMRLYLPIFQNINDTAEQTVHRLAHRLEI
ncbi:hypothetical protein [Geobacter sp. DSM 9736]|uniref:hypothetical protein n=1 Tax=Geobacter sp. DSM 9736 TaxID=1277350 RepID=UPI000B50D63B|nr:hypothetical protein [Geobacter sp. DSM 9736]SNB45671.1 hypothetical protein SAMN06269301_1097 [Geobacter sp. DSM 9736]